MVIKAKSLFGNRDLSNLFLMLEAEENILL
jgi:hypothetical protein